MSDAQRPNPEPAAERSPLIEVTIPLRSHDEAILVLGPYDRHAKLLRQSLDIELFTRGGNLRLKGVETDVIEARRRVEHLLGKVRKGRALGPGDIEAILLEPTNGRGEPESSSDGARSPRPDNGPGERRHFRPTTSAPGPDVESLRTRAVEPRSENQRRYLEAIDKNHLVFGLGAAGTGKTFLAVAAALRAMRSGECRRLVITRPVVEAGEHLGFLPGDLSAKLNPYLRPVYDSLSGLLRFEDVPRLEEAGVIEIAPLAYMRGRTLANSFVILDEAQNTTVAQMKMFLTRLGEGSRMVVTGDPSQSDLDRGQKSGLVDAVRRLRGFEGIATVEFGTKDIVRHPLVEMIVRAYELPAPVDRDKGERQGEESPDRA
jgi:phosphate starvation-inducible PhoH-like protein